MAGRGSPEQAKREMQTREEKGSSKTLIDLGKVSQQKLEKKNGRG